MKKVTVCVLSLVMAVFLSMTTVYAAPSGSVNQTKVAASKKAAEKERLKEQEKKLAARIKAAKKKAKEQEAARIKAVKKKAAALKKKAKEQEAARIKAARKQAEKDQFPEGQVSETDQPEVQKQQEAAADTRKQTASQAKKETTSQTKKQTTSQTKKQTTSQAKKQTTSQVRKQTSSVAETASAKSNVLQTKISESYGAHAMGMDRLKLYCNNYKLVRPVKVAVLDTSIMVEHQFFRGRTVENRMGRTAGSEWHGTICAGVIADSTPAWVKIYGYKVDSSRPETVVNAIRKAIDDGVEVISMSIAFDTGDPHVPELEKLFKEATERNIILVAAAANEKKDMCRVYPACSQYTLAVSALRQNSGRPGLIKYMSFDNRYSNFGTDISFCAPGTDIHTATNKSVNRCSHATGTSLATPHIAACFAYLKMFFPGRSNIELFKIMKAYCVDLGKPGFDSYYGWGVPYIKNMGNDFRGRVDRRLVKITSVKKKSKELTVKVKGVKGASYSLYRRKIKDDVRGWKKIKTISKGNEITVSANKNKAYEYIVLMKRGSYEYLSEYFRK